MSLLRLHQELRSLETKTKKYTWNHLLLLKASSHCLKLSKMYSHFFFKYLTKEGVLLTRTLKTSNKSNERHHNALKVSGCIAFLLCQYNYKRYRSYEYFKQKISINSSKWKICKEWRKPFYISESAEGGREGTKKMLQSTVTFILNFSKHMSLMLVGWIFLDWNI